MGLARSTRDPQRVVAQLDDPSLDIGFRPHTRAAESGTYGVAMSAPVRAEGPTTSRWVHPVPFLVQVSESRAPPCCASPPKRTTVSPAVAP